MCIWLRRNRSNKCLQATAVIPLLITATLVRLQLVQQLPQIGVTILHMHQTLLLHRLKIRKEVHGSRTLEVR